MTAPMHPLRALRLRNGFGKASDLADAAGISRRALYMIEAHDTAPTDDTIVKLAGALSVDPVDLHEQIQAYANAKAAA